MPRCRDDAPTHLPRRFLACDVPLQLHHSLYGRHGLQVDGHDDGRVGLTRTHGGQVQPPAQHLRACPHDDRIIGHGDESRRRRRRRQQGGWVTGRVVALNTLRPYHTASHPAHTFHTTKPAFTTPVDSRALHLSPLPCYCHQTPQHQHPRTWLQLPGAAQRSTACRTPGGGHRRNVVQGAARKDEL